MQSLLKIFNLSNNAPTAVPLGEDELSAEADEPPDDQLSPLRPATEQQDIPYSRSTAPAYVRRESLLTRALVGPQMDDDGHRMSRRGLSTTSSHSTASMPSTAELTSDGDTSPSRSTTPSPPVPAGRFSQLLNLRKTAPKVVIGPVTEEVSEVVAQTEEAAVEKTLGRKRCIMFACGKTNTETIKETVAKVEAKPAEPEPPKRRCALTFACPGRTNTNDSKTSASKLQVQVKSNRVRSPAPALRRKSTTESIDLPKNSADTARVSVTAKAKAESPKAIFHEFGTSVDETDTWVDKPTVFREKLTVNDCMKKENAIRQLAQEAEDEAEEEEREQEELEEQVDEDEVEDDFAPSDEDSDRSSDGGNESDDEGGFASSDEESDAGSEYQFWAPTNTASAATSTDNLPFSHFSARRRSEASSVESLTHSGSSQLHSMISKQAERRRKVGPRPARMRPGTPELPDSTDFVCGTFDEDRPLEAAYLSCREQRKREKHVPIPQDIDPSFPTTDPEDENEHSDDAAISHRSSEGPRWLKEDFAGFEDERRPSVVSSIAHSPAPVRPAPVGQRPSRTMHRSPPPRAARSPPPRKLFGHSPARHRSPFPNAKLRSPRGSPTATAVPTVTKLRGGLAQRPGMIRTASLPDTPNPFFKNFNIGSPSISNIASGAVTPAVEEPPRPDQYVRGPVDIVAGLEKKRQKRKEKYWRQHCRKAAKDQAERKPTRGRGAERMKELGLECAERARGYGLAGQQQSQLVLSL
jgi:hypothetical protein